MNDNDLNPIIGREHELSVLADFVNSSKPEFVAVYGRRRVGKTFLIRKAFNDKFAFWLLSRFRQQTNGRAMRVVNC